jgi:RNase P subunit RPR2
MKRKISKTEAKEKISSLFSKKSFSPEELKKIKRLAMKYRISLREHRKKFCKKCFTKLKGKIRVSKTHKTTICVSCGYKNKLRI